MFVPGVVGWMSYMAWIPLIYLAWIPFIVLQILLLSLAARRGNLDAQLLLVPFGLQFGAILGTGLLFGIEVSGHGGSLIAFLAGKRGPSLPMAFSHLRSERRRFPVPDFYSRHLGALCPLPPR